MFFIKEYEKPIGKVKNPRAMLDEVIAIKEKSRKLKPALAVGDDDPTFASSSGINFLRFTKTNLS